ncbi:MAG: tRNA uridine-5-carboxymethylaminomethyl(34) synthesis GTPase MnmE [Lachnospiraceae bacterium]|nr:tRNA uridine-5-carboxymethylaminomethyl(34) synthesis GTPase MnmE [Lachnospiraceae bacterium]
MKTDTIAAIATAISDAGIGIIRVSGDEAVSIVHHIYRDKNQKDVLEHYQSHTIHYGFIITKSGDIIDEVMISVMKAPHSYTMEDTVEINCHGGVLMMKKILMEVIQAGARMAEPGEFTKRAFLNGRIDLSRAEAVMDIIHAKNEFALKTSVQQLKGSVSDKIKTLRDQILYEIAFIESALDDPEHISLDGYEKELSEKTGDIEAELSKLLSSADDGRILKEGIRTVIVGKPNVGKSSLLNLFMGQDRAIVTDIAGTTRDTLEETIRFGDITLNIMDTAGIRDTEDAVEKIGVERAKKMSEEADLILYVIDSSEALDENDEIILKLIEGKKTIILLNKSDLMEVTDKNTVKNFYHKNIDHNGQFTEKDDSISLLRISAKEKEGLDELKALIEDYFFHGKIVSEEELYITNVRHKEAILEALESIRQVKQSLENHMPEDFYSIDLMSAYASLGRILGEEVGEDLVNKIFSEFCMGK